MVMWNKINAFAFPELMTEILTNHPSLESPVKEPPRKKARTGSILEQELSGMDPILVGFKECLV